jgi:UDP-N-acetylmuramate--alanine ligase
LADEFAQAFTEADALQVLDIYAASEEPIPGVSAQNLTQKIRAAGTKAEYASSFADAASCTLSAAGDGDLVLTLGAGNVYQIGLMVLEELEKRVASSAASQR